MKLNLFILLLAFVLISYLSIPGAMGVVPENAYSILLQRLLSSVILLCIVVYYSNREFLRTIFILNPIATRWLVVVIVVAMFLIPILYTQSNFDERKIMVY
jgi:hypothetical protein